MASHIYWVKQERGLFRKPEWSILINDLMIGLHKDRDTAVTEAVKEAERTSTLGRTTEVWVNEGMGFMLHKAFKASKQVVPDEDDGEGDGPGDGADYNE